MPPARLARIDVPLTAQPGDKPLACDVRGLKPELDLAFRFGAGYRLSIPLKQFDGSGRQMGILMRVTPMGGGASVYLGTRVFLRPFPKQQHTLETSGGFLVGEGKYRVDLAMYDDQDRVCRHSWNFTAALHHSQRNIKMAIPPGAVADLSGRGLPPGSNLRDDSPPFRLTVLLQAAPVSLRRATLQPRDRILLLGTLATMLNQMPLIAVRLVVFNLDQQMELYRRDDFQVASISEVNQAIGQLNLQKVDYSVVRNRSGGKDMLTDLTDREAVSPTPPDAVIFLGPYARQARGAPDMAELAGGFPYFYFQLLSPFAPTPPFPDMIAKAIARSKGKVIAVKKPADFASAMAQVERAAAARTQTIPR
jgi:hypothetical protein